jgi:hypothetical protein
MPMVFLIALMLVGCDSMGLHKKVVFNDELSRTYYYDESSDDEHCATASCPNRKYSLKKSDRLFERLRACLHTADIARIGCNDLLLLEHARKSPCMAWYVKKVEDRVYKRGLIVGVLRDLIALANGIIGSHRALEEVFGRSLTSAEAQLGRLLVALSDEQLRDALVVGFFSYPAIVDKIRCMQYHPLKKGGKAMVAGLLKRRGRADLLEMACGQQ